MNNLEGNYWRSNFQFRFVGYILLILALLEVMNILIPLRFTNSNWELQTVGALVEVTPVPLLGMVLVFIGGSDNRNKKVEVLVLRVLSWCCLLMGVLFILLLPLGINSSWRIDKQNNAQIISNSSQQLEQAKRVKDLLGKVTTDEDISRIFKSLNPTANTPDLKNPQDVKKQILSQIERLETDVKNQSNAAKRSNRLKLIKSSVKWNLGSIICAFAFIWLWRTTRWARLK
ncbi:HpsJ family protein [Cronbergia sp. UHCC 0137]|uniref:HpsJ-like protein, cyanoexosortase A-associated n=1 Tax=Cronbergia sp. UHCC 0137 TaxID=3110239 RepID=UPI002B1EAEF8|nr:HpsJ family protein [Cronbergia sp. UHCC 0137]MEA5620208.1 HpsJ family protein [Cronbergia sp. UHCC 0137]